MNTTILVIIIIIVKIHEKDSFKFELKTWNIICNPYLCNFKIFNRKKCRVNCLDCKKWVFHMQQFQNPQKRPQGCLLHKVRRKWNRSYLCGWQINSWAAFVREHSVSSFSGVRVWGREKHLEECRATTGLYASAQMVAQRWLESLSSCQPAPSTPALVLIKQT